VKLPFNPGNKKTQALVALFLIALIGFLSCFSQKAEGSDLRVEAGSAMLRGWTPTLGFSANYIDAGPGYTDLEAGILLVGESEHRGEPQSNTGTLYGMVWSSAGPVDLGIGVAYTQGVQTYTCDTTFALGARYRPTRRLTVQWRHFSSADTCQPNTGRDLLTVSWRMGK
jgi:hypothetical protein